MLTSLAVCAEEYRGIIYERISRMLGNGVRRLTKEHASFAMDEILRYSATNFGEAVHSFRKPAQI